MFKPCRIRLIITNLITNLITTRLIIGIRRCHFPLAGAEDMAEAGAVADMAEAGAGGGMAGGGAGGGLGGEGGAVADMGEGGAGADMAEAGMVAAGMAAAEKFVNDGGQIHLFEPLEPRF